MSIAQELMDSLPPQYQNSEVLKVLATVIGRRFEPIETALQALESSFDPDLMPDSTLDWATYSRGWFVVQWAAPYAKRKALKKVTNWRKHWGQTGVFEDVLFTYTKTSAITTGVTATFYPRDAIDGGFRIGKARIGKRYIWSDHSANEIIVAVTNAGSTIWDTTQRTRVLSLLKQMMPPWMTFTLIDP